MFSGRRAFSRSNRQWWAAITEAVVAAALLLLGVAMLAIALTLAVLYSTPDRLYISVWSFALQLLLATMLIGIGAYRIIATLWKVGASAERRGAIANRASEFELFNEIGRPHYHFPSVPADPHPPRRGSRLKFRLQQSKTNLLGLIFWVMLSLVFLAAATTLILTANDSFWRGQLDWWAGFVAVPIALAACWSAYNFVRQLLKLTAIGPSSIEVSDYPLIPGKTYQVCLLQPGRVRLKLIDVLLECQEEATYTQGTNHRTERRTVFQQRLLRRRGVVLRPDQPLEASFEIAIPLAAMHSFKSASNRITWKIVVLGQARGWPQLTRNFAILVLPPSEPASRTDREPVELLPV
jgi:hypothetical protein